MSKRSIRKNRHREDKGVERKTWTWKRAPQHVVTKKAEVSNG